MNVINNKYKKIMATAKLNAFLDMSYGIHKNGTVCISVITRFLDKS